MTTENTVKMRNRGTSKRAALLRALPHYGYQRDKAEASLRMLDDGSWVATRVRPWWAVATIPMPARQAPSVIAIGFRGREWEVGDDE